jgi:hypothetical protein
MDIDACYLQGKFAENNKLVKNIGVVVRKSSGEKKKSKTD